jgi:hypothetical protein
MFIFVKNRIELHKLNTKVRALEKFYWGLAKDAKKEGKGRNEIDDIYGNFFSELGPYRLDLYLLKSSILTIKASKYNVPLPDRDKKELWGTTFDDSYLTDKGRFIVNKAIREELKERLNTFTQIITVLAGLIGVLIGLITVLKN